VDAAIRAAVPSDADAIAAVQIASWRSAYRGLVPDAFLDDMDAGERSRRLRSHLTAGRGGRRTYVAEIAGEVVGFATAGECRDPDARARDGELYAIYVLAVRWRRGIGTALHAAAADGLRNDGCVEARLWVLEANAAARRFYERLGWLPDGSTEPHPFGAVELPIVRYRLGL
jgi:GNAT superfamily N-acetyltransferase